MIEEQNTEALKKARTFSDNKDKIDGFYNGYVQATIELQRQVEIDAEHIRALQKQNGELTDKVNDLEDKLANADYQLEGRDNEIRELKEQNIKDCENFNKVMKEIKEQWNNEHYHLTKAKEIIKNLMVFAEMDDREYEKEYKDAEQFLKEE